MKGPFTTQTLSGLPGTGPLHWRGDKPTFADFNGAFPSLLGRSEELTAAEMFQFRRYIDTVEFPPQPNRTIDDKVATTFVNGGSPERGKFLYVLGCNACHGLPTGTIGMILPPLGLIEAPAEAVKIPHVRNAYTKVRGEGALDGKSKSAFGFLHDGALPLSGPGSFIELVEPLFHNEVTDPQYEANFGIPAEVDQMSKDMEAFLLSFPVPNVHTAVGKQLTFTSLSGLSAEDAQLFSALMVLAGNGDIALTFRITISGLQTTGLLDPVTGFLMTESKGQLFDLNAIIAFAESTSTPLTVTAYDIRSFDRILDRDGDGCFNFDELTAGSNPRDKDSIPATGCL
jgi:hypothetical protein